MGTRMAPAPSATSRSSRRVQRLAGPIRKVMHTVNGHAASTRAYLAAPGGMPASLSFSLLAVHLNPSASGGMSRVRDRRYPASASWPRRTAFLGTCPVRVSLHSQRSMQRPRRAVEWRECERAHEGELTRLASAVSSSFNTRSCLLCSTSSSARDCRMNLVVKSAITGPSFRPAQRTEERTGAR